MSKKQSTILVTTFILIAAVAVVVWGGERKQPEQPSPAGNGGDVVSQDSNISQNREDIDTNDNDNDPIPISDEDPIVITSDIDTSDWKTYRNEELGFSFRYPEGWKMREYKKGEPKSDPTPFRGLIEILNKQGELAFFVVVDDRFEYIDVQNLTNKFEENYLGDSFKERWDIQSVQVADIYTKKYSSNKMIRMVVPLVKERNLIAVYWNLSFSDIEIRPEEMFDAVLDSFTL